jgi:hypothetical protein
MTHLTDIELANGIENALPDALQRHVDDCQACRGKLDDLRATLTRVSEDRVPEPSPLFWAHFSARVRDGVRDAELTRTRRPAWLQWTDDSQARTWSGVAAVAVVAVLVAAALRVNAPWLSGRSTDPISQGDGTGASADALDQARTDLGAIESDNAWALVRTVADEAPWDDEVAAGLDARPGWADRAALDLNVDERRELLHLLVAETKRPGA